MNQCNDRATRATKSLRDCEVCRVNPIPAHKTAPATPLCISSIRYPYPLRGGEARYLVDTSLIHLRDCEVCEVTSTLIGKIGINVIYILEWDRPRKPRSPAKANQNRRYSLVFPPAGTKRRGKGLGRRRMTYATPRPASPILTSIGVDQGTDTAASIGVDQGTPGLIWINANCTPCALRIRKGGSGVNQPV